MKVCFVSHSSEYGGAERAMIETMDALMGRGVECFVLLHGTGPLSRELNDRNIPFHVLPFGYWMGWETTSLRTRMKGIIKSLAASFSAARRIRGWGCDVICTNTITICTGAVASAILRLPHVWYIQEFGYEDHGLVFYLGQRLSLKIMNAFSAAYVACSVSVADKYRQWLTPSKVKVSYYSMHSVRALMGPEEGRDSSIPVSPRAGCFRCAIVGKIIEGKNQEDAVRAARELVKTGVKIELLIVGGESQYRKYLDRLVHESGLTDFVKFVGYVQNPLRIMQDSDVILVCSRSEAFGRVTVEGMLAGKPVIGARSGGTSELIGDGFNGFLYTPGNFAELADRIRYLHDNPEAAARLGRNGRNWASARFNRDRHGREILSLLSSLPDRKSLGRSIEHGVNSGWSSTLPRNRPA